MRLKQNISWRGRRGLFFLLVSLIFLLNFWRLSGGIWLQEQEFSFFDYAQIRSHQSLGPLATQRIAIVGITDEDLLDFPVTIPDDLTLAELLLKIREQKPQVIGLDLIRDRPVGEGIQQLEEVFRTTPNLYRVGKFNGIAGDRYFSTIAPPPVLGEQGRVGEISVMVDDDGVVRRGNLIPFFRGEDSVYSLALQLALNYLNDAGYGAKNADSPEGAMQIGEVVFPFFHSDDGGYIGVDDSGYQILMNWYNPSQSWPHVSLTDVLAGDIPPDLFTDKIVVIGYYTVTLKQDIFPTPLSSAQPGETPRSAFGVELQANLTDYLLRTVIDGEPVLKSVADGAESLIISCWIIATGIAIWWLKSLASPLRLILFSLTITGFFAGVCWELNYQLFVAGWWLPVFPLIAILVTGFTTILYLFRERNLEQIEGLKGKVDHRTSQLQATNQKLQQTNQKLEITIEELERSQKQLIEQEKLAFLSRLTAGFCHQFRSPFYSLKYTFITFQNVFGEFKLSSDSEQYEELERLKTIVKAGETSIEKLELLFDLILVSPHQRSLAFLDAVPNNFVQTVISSVVLFRSSDDSSYLNQILIFALDPNLNAKTQLPQQLKIPLFNLVDNAVDAVLTREEEEEPDFLGSIQVITRKLAKEWEIKVIDNGGGIEPAVKDQLFQPFVTSKAESEGIGLGLWMSQEMMQNYIGGQISVSTSDAQTEFTLTIPFFG